MKIVVHWTTGNENMALGNADAILHDSRTDTEEMAIVAMGNSIHQVTGSGTEFMDKLRHLMNHDVAIKACRNSMDANDISEPDLIEGVEAVESGPGEIAVLQDHGYRYFRP